MDYRHEKASQRANLIDVAMDVFKHSREISTMLMLLDCDVNSAELSYRLYREAADEINARFAAMASGVSENFDKRPGSRAVFIHACNFVCAVRRAARLLESIVSERHQLPTRLADAIRIEWRKKRSFFDTFVDPRNAIEHIDGERTSHRFYQLLNDRLTVTDGNSVTIDDHALGQVLSVREAIADAVLSHYGTTRCQSGN